MPKELDQLAKEAELLDIWLNVSHCSCHTLSIDFTKVELSTDY